MTQTSVRPALPARSQERRPTSHVLLSTSAMMPVSVCNVRPRTWMSLSSPNHACLLPDCCIHRMVKENYPAIVFSLSFGEGELKTPDIMSWWVYVCVTRRERKGGREGGKQKLEKKEKYTYAKWLIYFQLGIPQKEIKETIMWHELGVRDPHWRQGHGQ